MIQAKCIQKFRDKTGKIYGYRLTDINGAIQDVQSENLKRAIANNQIHIVNLTLTADNRLVDSSEKQLQSKALGKAPVTPDTKYTNVAKALVYLDKELLDMGDSYFCIVQARGEDAGISLIDYAELGTYYNKEEYKHCKNEEQLLDKILFNIHIKLLTNYPEKIATIIEIWNTADQYEIFEENLEYERASKLSQSKIYKSLCLVYKYAKEKKFSSDIVTPLEKFLKKLKDADMIAVTLGYAIGHRYSRYLKDSVFGTISNDVFTVGHKITTSDIREHKEYKGYSYILHKDINRCGAPEIALAALFKSIDTDNIQVDIKIARHGYVSEHCVDIVGYIGDLASETISSENTEDNIDYGAQIVAKYFNKLGTKLYDIADAYQTLYLAKELEAPLETIGKIEKTHDDKEALNLAISRWTTTRGDETPAEIDTTVSTDTKILYKNNIGSNADYPKKLLITYENNIFSVDVMDGDKSMIHEESPMTGKISDNSAIISEVLAEALISANVKDI